MVTWVHNQLLSLLGEVAHVKELHVVGVDADIANEVTHLTIGCLIQIRKETIFKLRVVNLLGVVSDFLVNSYFESGLVSKDVLELGLINRHTLLVSIVKLGALESIPVLGVKVLLLTKLGEFLLNCL